MGSSSFVPPLATFLADAFTPEEMRRLALTIGRAELSKELQVSSPNETAWQLAQLASRYGVERDTVEVVARARRSRWMDLVSTYAAFGRHVLELPAERELLGRDLSAWPLPGPGETRRLCGEPGVGVSAVAAALARQAGAAGRNVLWCAPAQREGRPPRKVLAHALWKELGIEDRPPADQEKLTLWSLTGLGWVMVLDDATEDEVATWRAAFKDAGILVTSRSAPALPEDEIPPLDLASAVGLLRARGAARFRFGSGPSQADLEALVEAVGRQPAALILAGDALRSLSPTRELLAQVGTAHGRLGAQLATLRRQQVERLRLPASVVAAAARFAAARDAWIPRDLGFRMAGEAEAEHLADRGLLEIREENGEMSFRVDRAYRVSFAELGGAAAQHDALTGVLGDLIAADSPRALAALDRWLPVLEALAPADPAALALEGDNLRWAALRWMDARLYAFQDGERVEAAASAWAAGSADAWRARFLARALMGAWRGRGHEAAVSSAVAALEASIAGAGKAVGEARHYLGRGLARLRRDTEAEATLRAALDHLPTRSFLCADTRVALGLVLLRRGDPDALTEAGDLFAIAAEGVNGRERLRARYGAARVWAAQGHLDMARAEISAVIAEQTRRYGADDRHTLDSRLAQAAMSGDPDAEATVRAEQRRVSGDQHLSTRWAGPVQGG